MHKLISPEELELKATEFRQKNGMGATEPIKIKSFLQKLKVLTIYKSLSPGFSGMAIKIDVDGNTDRFMLVNSNHSIGKQHFTICHELYHLFIQNNFHATISNTGLFDKKNPEEYNADMFASFLLLPRLGLIMMIPEEQRKKDSISYETLLEIEQFYGCSHSALLQRLLNIGYITLAKKEELSKIGIKNLARKMGYDISLYEDGNRDTSIGNYGRLAYKAWEEGIVSQSAYISLLSDLGIDVSKLDEI